MSSLKAGFARVDVTPSLGFPIEGYFEKRYADGVLDNLYATAVVFDNDEKRAVIISIDAIGMQFDRSEIVRKAIAEKINTDPDGVYIACTHTHLGLGFRTEERSIYKGEDAKLVSETFEIVKNKLCDAAMLAVNDLKPCKLYYTRGIANDVSYIRRFRMKDGSSCTNPGYYGELVDAPLSEADNNVQHLIIKRDEGFDIGIVNFQVHPDVIGGCTLSADYPKFVRDTYEKILDNTRCMYLNGAQGDSNHNDIRIPFEHPMRRGYKRAQYMGRKIAMAAIADYELALPLEGDKISFGHKIISVKYNKGLRDEIPFAKEVTEFFKKEGSAATAEYVSKKTGLPIVGDQPWKKPARYEMMRLKRIFEVEKLPDEVELSLSAISVGDVVFGGIPGEPFTEVGRYIKNNSNFTLTIPTCCTNGYEGYYPTEDAFGQGSYEDITARFACGTAEKIAKGVTELINSFEK